MEKKNMVLLTVIAVATLLVAVVGATFAYYTASVKVSNTEQSTTTIKTKALASATMTNGDNITSEDGVLPGFKAVKSITIAGSCGGSAAECESISTTLTVTANIPEAFGTDVSWYLIKKSSNEISCEEPQVAGTATDPSAGTYMTTECSNVPETLASDGEGSVLHGTGNGSSAEVKTLDITVTGTTNDTYYLYVDYKNSESEQNTQQGKEFSIKLDFAAKQA